MNLHENLRAMYGVLPTDKPTRIDLTGNNNLTHFTMQGCSVRSYDPMRPASIGIPAIPSHDPVLPWLTNMETF